MKILDRTLDHCSTHEASLPNDERRGMRSMFILSKTRTTLTCTIAAFFLAVASASTAAAQLKVGGDTAAGTIQVRGTDSDEQLLFEVGADVIVGRGNPNSAEVDLLVMDPDHTSAIFRVVSGDGRIELGHGSPGAPGNDGDLAIFDHLGHLALDFNGNTGSLFLSDPGSSGDITLASGAGNALQISGLDGNVVNATAGNGLVKGWCQVDGNGNVLASYRCSASRTALGTYDVDFTTVDTDIRGRPFLVSCSGPNFSGQSCEGVRARNDASDFSAVQVLTSPAASDAGPFTIVLF